MCACVCADVCACVCVSGPSEKWAPSDGGHRGSEHGEDICERPQEKAHAQRSAPPHVHPHLQLAVLHVAVLHVAVLHVAVLHAAVLHAAVLHAAALSP